MAHYEYLVVPFMGQLKGGFINVENARKVSDQLQAVINQYTQNGWEYYSIDKVDIQITPGCLAALFGAKVSFITFDQVIFRHPLT
jgi:hypothetical protein